MEPAHGLITDNGLPCAPDELVGGFRATDVVYATEANDQGFGKGDVGLVFGPGRVAGALLVRFEAIQSTGEPMWCTMRPGILSKEAPLWKCQV